MRTTVIYEKTLHLRFFGGLSVRVLGLPLMFVYFIKVGFALEQFKNTVFP